MTIKRMPRLSANSAVVSTAQYSSNISTSQTQQAQAVFDVKSRPDVKEVGIKKYVQKTKKPRQFGRGTDKVKAKKTAETTPVVRPPRPKYDGGLNVNTGNLKVRVVIGHPVTGLVRVEWVMGRFGQTIPCNWSQCDILQFMSPYVPLNYQIADAENLIAKSVVESDAEWLLMWEHDNIPPNDALVRLNEYMIEGKVPVVAGLYFTKSIPPEPLVYRGIGNGYYDDWKMGDKVWCSGLPFGFTLIHGSLIKTLWNESPEYLVNNQITRRVFQAPQTSWMDPVKGVYVTAGGTTDLAWCERIRKDKIFEKAGWPEYQKMEYPFLIDTSIFVRHIDNNGVQWPMEIPLKFRPVK